MGAFVLQQRVSETAVIIITMIVIPTFGIHFTNKDYTMKVEDATCTPSYLTIQLMIQKIFIKYLKKGDRIS